MSVLFDRYLREALLALAPRTQSDYRKYIERLRPVLNEWEPSELTAGDVFDIRATIAQESGVVQANRHASCLSAVFREAIGWKAVTINPCLQLKRLREPPRTRYVFDHEFTRIYGIASDAMQVMMDIATITGQREGDLLKLPNRAISAAKLAIRLETTKEMYAFTVFERAFKDFGLPLSIRTDNGVPFASRSAFFGLSKLSVWWLRLGIGIERIKPGNPNRTAATDGCI
jgi:hypothetical protein